MLSYAVPAPSITYSIRTEGLGNSDMNDAAFSELSAWLTQPA